MSSNFDLTFGKLPTNFIGRKGIIYDISNDFNSVESSSYVYFITGVRGSGKTVLMNKIMEEFANDKNWVVISCNPNENILEQIAASIYNNEHVKHLFVKTSFNFSFHGVGFTIEGKEPISDVRTLIKKMLDYIQKSNKRILICIDEASNSKEIKSFAHDYQSFLGQGYEMYLLLTGLYENINNLQNTPTLTFLYRAPKIYLSSLEASDIFKSYRANFKDASDEEIKRLTILTKGYSYAFQLLGYLYTKYGQINKELLEEYDETLKIYCYEKIYENIPTAERDILKTIPIEGTCSSRFMVDHSSYKINEISVYKSRLINRGILKNQKGVFEIILPRFSNYLSEKSKIEF